MVEIRNSHLSQGSSSGNSTTGSLIFSTFASMGLNVMEADGLSFTKDSLLSVNDRDKYE